MRVGVRLIEHRAGDDVGVGVGVSRDVAGAIADGLDGNGAIDRDRAGGNCAAGFAGPASVGSVTDGGAWSGG